jgi:hypothetical protein
MICEPPGAARVDASPFIAREAADDVDAACA